MAKIGSMYITWNEQGHTTFSLDENNFDDKFIESLYSLGGIALIDHMIATLTAKNVVALCTTIIYGVIDNKLEIQPIGSELKSAQIEFHRGSVIYTHFKSQSKLFSNNQKLEAALCQMTTNTLSKLLTTASKENNVGIRFGVLGIISSYEHNLRIMFDQKLNRQNARVNAAKAVGMFINKFPYGVTDEDFENQIKSAPQIIEKWKNLPLIEDKSIFYA